MRTAAATGDLGHAGGGRLDEHDAEALLLEAAPPVAAEHREHVGGAVEGGQVLEVHAAEEAHRHVEAPGEPLEAGTVAAAAADGEDDVGVRALQAGDGLDEGVEALPGHEPAQPEHQRRGLREAEAPAGRPALLVVERDEPVDVDAGRDDDGRQPAPGGPLGLRQRVPAGRHDQPGLAQQAAEQLPAAGDATGDGDLGAVEDEPERPGQAGPEGADGQGRVEQDQLGPDLLRELVDAPAQRRARQQHAAPGPGRPGTACSASHAAASGWAVVSTVTSSGGRRRHSSHR